MKSPQGDFKDTLKETCKAILAGCEIGPGRWQSEKTTLTVRQPHSQPPACWVPPAVLRSRMSERKPTHGRSQYGAQRARCRRASGLGFLLSDQILGVPPVGAGTAQGTTTPQLHGVRVGNNSTHLTREK